MIEHPMYGDHVIEIYHSQFFPNLCYLYCFCSVGKRSGHIPYRDSKLTRILQHSLGGNARTAIICTLSPAMSHLEQSRNTLFFATRAKEVTNNARVNMVIICCSSESSRFNFTY